MGSSSKSSSPTYEVVETPETVQKATTKSITESAQTARDNQTELASKQKGLASTILTNQNSSSGNSLLGS